MKRAESREQRKESSEQRSGSAEQEEESRKQKAESREMRAESREQEAESWKQREQRDREVEKRKNIVPSALHMASHSTQKAGIGRRLSQPSAIPHPDLASLLLPLFCFRRSTTLDFLLLSSYLSPVVCDITSRMLSF
jgi:hypothetical protein